MRKYTNAALATVATLALAFTVGCAGGGAKKQVASDDGSSAAASAQDSSSSDGAASDDSGSQKDASLVADDLVSVESVATAKSEDYEKGDESYDVDVTLKNVADGTHALSGKRLGKLDVETIQVQYLDAQGNIMDTDDAYVSGSADTITLAQGQSARFDVSVDTGQGITQIRLAGITLKDGDDDAPIDFSDPSKLTYKVVSPLGTAD